MTSAEALRPPLPLRLSLPRWALIATAGCVVLVVLFSLTASNAFGQAGLWENAHWTWAAGLAAGLSLYGVARSSRYRSIAIWIAAGPVLTLIGQLTYDLIVARGAFTVPALYDPVFLIAYPIMVIGLFIAVRRVLNRTEGAVFLIDAAVGLVIIAVLTIAVFDETLDAVGGVAAGLLTAYPVVFMGTSAATVLALMVLRKHGTGPGLVLITIGSLLMGLDWASWLAVALQGPPEVGSLLNYLWSVGVVLTGIGTVTWRFQPSPTFVSDELRFLRGILPVVALLLGLVVLLAMETHLDFAVEALVAFAVVLAMTRQTLMLFEREGLAAREMSAAAEAEQQRSVAEAALASQRTVEERYRSTVEVFNKLGDQVSFASREEDLLRSAVAAMARLAPSDAGELFIVNASQSRLVVAVSWGDDPRPVGTELDEPPANCLGIRRGSAYLVEDAADELTLACPAHPANTGSVICVPLMALGETVGVAHLERREPRSFAADAPREVSRVAEQVALAIANTRMLHTMESLALTDQLTRLHNARFFDPFLDRELATALRDEQPLAVIMIDLDHFKQFNDTHGHAAGDEALKTFAHALLSVARDSDTVARYGGEEFVVSARHADLEGGAMLAERMRLAVERSPVELGPGRFVSFTASFGVASTTAQGTDRHSLMKAADDALYRAKHNGRNRVEKALPSSGDAPAGLSPGAERRVRRRADGPESVG